MPKKCLQCSETAPYACEKDLCGRCCEPQCKPNVHKKPRRVVRGTSGRQARLRTIQSWKAANKRFRLECKNARCGQLAGELGISKKQLRRAFLCDLIEEARLRREPLQGSPTGNLACDETEALAAALLAPVQRRVGLIDDLIEGGEDIVAELDLSDGGISSHCQSYRESDDSLLRKRGVEYSIYSVALAETGGAAKHAAKFDIFTEDFSAA